MKRCEAQQQEGRRVKTRCTRTATHLVVASRSLYRMCEQCAKRWDALTVVDGEFQSLGVLPMNDRANPELIAALRVRYALERKG